VAVILYMFIILSDQHRWSSSVAVTVCSE